MTDVDSHTQEGAKSTFVAEAVAAAGGAGRDRPESPAMTHLALPDLEAGLDRVRAAPADQGRLELIVRRPTPDEREILDRGTLDPEHGLVGDRWGVSGDPRNGGRPLVDAQVTVMNARLSALVSGGDDRDRWALAGDQLHVDLDIGEENLPPGTRLAIGGATLEITAEPHTGCGKFSRRYGVDAMRFVNSRVGRALRLRGLNARVVEAGEIAAGDRVRKLS